MTAYVIKETHDSVKISIHLVRTTTRV